MDNVLQATNDMITEHYCYGNAENGLGVIKALEARGGYNRNNFDGKNPSAIYYTFEGDILQNPINSHEGKIVASYFNQVEPIDIEDKLPKTLLNVYDGRITDTIRISSMNAEKLQLLDQLIIVRDKYRDGWLPDWSIDEKKYTISCLSGKLQKDTLVTRNEIFTFQSAEIRDKFFNAFREELEEVKWLL